MVKHEDSRLGRNTGQEKRQLSANNIDFGAKQARTFRRESNEDPESAPIGIFSGSNIAFRDDKKKIKSLIQQSFFSKPLMANIAMEN